MAELIIIKTNNFQELKKLLEEKHINYEIYQKKEKKLMAQQIIKKYQAERKVKEKELAKAYEEWANNPNEWTNEDEAWED
ncbi:MAG: hypothetical protein I3274_03540 [Candidatus Moeniiplasma glomeromycotorum]|nr:hypothetical protein [Candidatus Moeniiplasma glomeromycotorum]